MEDFDFEGYDLEQVISLLQKVKEENKDKYHYIYFQIEWDYFCMGNDPDYQDRRYCGIKILGERYETEEEHKKRLLKIKKEEEKIKKRQIEEQRKEYLRLKKIFEPEQNNP
jgi:hypothetical protein